MESNHKTCGTCRHFIKQDNMKTEGGECHRHPPSVVLVPLPGAALGLQRNAPPQLVPMGAWPPVRIDAWCGDHQPEVQLGVVNLEN